jgi:signal transduction histidine kinase
MVQEDRSAVVPMMIKEQVIGVIEVLNKVDLTIFSRDDQYLLQAFASQAAVAIENARLYTQTDQKLAARVEELSVMQHIDRELNTTLDTQRAMSIALDWALNQSNMAAGVAGLVEGENIRVMAHTGYTDELKEGEEFLPAVQTFDLQKFLAQGVALTLHLDGVGKHGLLHEAASQVVIPIRRENNTIGLLLLENNMPEVVSVETTEFLCDHASIAISNAQLYSAVQNANVAKSEFVSFVSHELKNPMTSIKGYTELIAAGAVGPVSEAQANFLTTIRSNVERMSTLISDLADVSRIEAGKLKLDFKAIPLKEVVEEVNRSIAKQVEEKKQTFTVQLPEDLPLVWGDRTRLLQIITNLASNGLKYTPQGGQILLAAEEADNLWETGKAPRVVHVWVNDNGIGMNEEDQKKIFQKFFRSEDPKAREVMGTGLGLNITKSLVEFQGGKIWFESEYRKGTTFHFTIPVSD